MMIWSGWGILIVLLVGMGIAGSGYAEGHGWIPQNPYTMTIGILVSAIAVWLVGKPLRDDDGRNRHALFFIPWTYWPILILALGAYTGWTAYSLDAAAKKDPLGFTVSNQAGFDAAMTAFIKEKDRIRDVYTRRESLSDADKTAFERDVASLKQRQQELLQLSKRYKARAGAVQQQQR